MKCLADKSLIVVVVLGVALLLMVVGGGVMNYNGRDIDARFYEILNLIVLGLIALLKTGSGSEPTGTEIDPLSVKGTKGESEAIATTDAGPKP